MKNGYAAVIIVEVNALNIFVWLIKNAFLCKNIININIFFSILDVLVPVWLHE